MKNKKIKTSKETIEQWLNYLNVSEYFKNIPSWTCASYLLQTEEEKFNNYDSALGNNQWLFINLPFHNAEPYCKQYVCNILFL